MMMYVRENWFDYSGGKKERGREKALGLRFLELRLSHLLFLEDFVILSLLLFFRRCSNIIISLDDQIYEVYIKPTSLINLSISCNYSTSFSHTSS